MKDMDEYSHTPLSVTERQIRLVRIRYVSNTPTLDLAIHEWAEAPDYRALSYTWGPLTPTHIISINNQSFHVRHNLFTFLEKMGKIFAGFVETAPDFVTPYFWIDQICIDQTNTAERNAHVRYMSQIYRTAEIVYIWLADTTISSEKNAAPQPTDPTMNVTETPLTHEDMAEILSDPYFSRLWVVQEMILSKVRGFFIPGDAAIFFDTIANACTFETDALAALGVSRRTMAILSDVCWSRYQTAPLGQWIAKYSTQLCADPRDKVYGFLGLVGFKEKVVVDYSKSVHEVSLDVAMLFRNTFLITKVHWRDMNFKYPTTPQDYYDTLRILWKEMGIEGAEHVALCEMLREIWVPDADSFQLDDEERPDFPRVTDMGFVAVRTNEIIDVDSSDGKVVGDTHWWYECEGERHTFICGQ